MKIRTITSIFVTSILFVACFNNEKDNTSSESIDRGGGVNQDSIPLEQGEFKNGKRNGIWKFYSEAGDLVEDVLYNNGVIISKNQYSAGKIRAKVVYDYDADGYIIGKSVFDSNDSLMEQNGLLTTEELNNTRIYESADEALKHQDEVFRIEFKEFFEIDFYKPELPVALQKLKNLQYLSVCNLEFAEAPFWILDFKHLQVLKLCYLEHYPKQVLENIDRAKFLKELDISNVKLQKLPEPLFTVEKLEYLSIANNENLTEIPASIAKLKKLKKLDASGTGLTTLPKEIGQLSLLTNLNLRDSKIESLPSELKNLNKLEEIDLGYNKHLKSFPDVTGGLENIVELKLEYCDLAQLPEGIGTIVHLQKLDVSHNNLDTFPEFLGKLTKLQELNMYDTKIAFISDQISGMKGLEELNISGAILKELPNGFGELNNLKYLLLGAENLEKLPASFTELENLSVLNLNSSLSLAKGERFKNLIDIMSKLDVRVLEVRGVGLTELPPNIGELKELQRLDLTNNQITMVPVEVVKLDKLTTLRLRGNPLNTISIPITELNNLNTLTIGSRSVKHFNIPTEIGRLVNLQYLDLIEANVTELPEEIGQLTALKELNVNGAGIKTLPESMSQLKQLRLFGFFNNSLSSVQKEWLESNLPNLNID